MNKRGDSKVGSNDSLESPDRGETPDISGVPSGRKLGESGGTFEGSFGGERTNTETGRLRAALDKEEQTEWQSV